MVTLATVEPSGEVSHVPQIRAASTAGQVVLAVDSCLIIFSSDCSEATPLVFHHNINTTAISECGRFLSAGLQNGSMQFVHLPLARVLSGQQVCVGLEQDQGLTFTSSLYARSEGEDTSKLILCRQDGQLYTFSHLELERLHTAIMAEDLETIRASQARIVVEVEEVGGPVTDCAVLPTDLRTLSATRTGLVRDSEAGDRLDLPGCVKIVTHEAGVSSSLWARATPASSAWARTSWRNPGLLPSPSSPPLWTRWLEGCTPWSSTRTARSGPSAATTTGAWAGWWRRMRNVFYPGRCLCPRRS